MRINKFRHILSETAMPAIGTAAKRGKGDEGNPDIF
jgi:hypothetical protein